MRVMIVSSADFLRGWAWPNEALAILEQAMPNAISVRDFARLSRQAEKALKDGDAKTLLDINERVGKLGYRLVQREGILHFQQMNIADAQPEDKTEFRSV